MKYCNNVDQNLVNEFVINLQRYGSAHNVTMWLTQLEIKNLRSNMKIFN